jgi:S-adenosyl-L-methionine hydrolase (adenosine-forming)
MADGTIQCVRLLENRALFAADISPTFHGRDIMAPAAALLAGGFPFAEVGPLVDIVSCVQLNVPKPVLANGILAGQVMQADHFGNLRTNITAADLRNFASIIVSIKGRSAQFCTTYAAAPTGTLLALIDSAGYLELAVNQGSAAQMLDCDIGEAVSVRHRQN